MAADKFLALNFWNHWRHIDQGSHFRRRDAQQWLQQLQLVLASQDKTKVNFKEIDIKLLESSTFLCFNLIDNNLGYFICSPIKMIIGIKMISWKKLDVLK